MFDLEIGLAQDLIFNLLVYPLVIGLYMGFLNVYKAVIFFILVSFVISIEETYVNCCNDACYSKKSFATCSGNRPQTVVSSSSRSDSFDAAEDLQDLQSFEKSSLEGRDVPCQDHRNHGEQRTMALRGLQTTTQTICGVLPSLPTPLAKHHRPLLCSQSRSSTRWECYMDTGDMEQCTNPSYMESAQVQKQRTDAERSEKIQEHTRPTVPVRWQRTSSTIPDESILWKRSGQSADAAIATSSVPMARICPTWSAHDVVSTTDAIDDDIANAINTESADSSDADAFGTNGTSYATGYTSAVECRSRTKGDHRDGEGSTNGIAPRHETESPTHVQVRGRSSNKRSSLCCEKLGICEERCRRGSTSALQLDHIMEALPGRSCTAMAGIHNTLPAARARTPDAHPASPSGLYHSQSTGRAIAGRGREDQHHRDHRRGGRATRRSGIHGEGLWSDPRRAEQSHSISAAASGQRRGYRDGGKISQKAKNCRECGQGSRHGDKRWQCSSWRKAAFCLARLCMTFSYDNLGLCRHWDSSTPAIIMKWNNRAVCNEAFVSEWQARENALTLSRDHLAPSTSTSTCVGSASSRRRDTMQQQLEHLSSRPSRRSSLHVGFAEDLELWIGVEDSLKMYKLTVPIEVGATGTTPWSCPNSPFSEEGHRDQRFLAHTSSDGRVTIQRQPSRPTWANGIEAILNEEGLVDEAEEDMVVYVTSYFISHRDLPYHATPRILRFDRNVAEWERDVRFMWEDLVDHAAALDVVVVRPDPPRPAYPGTSVTVIVHQHFRHDRAACLISTAHIMDPTTRFSVSAHSTELYLTPHQVRQHARVDQVCQQRARQGAGQCEVHIGHHLQPEDQAIAIFHGLAMYVRVPSLLSEDEIEQNLICRIQRQRRLREGDAWDPNEEEAHPEENHPRQSEDQDQGGDEAPEDAIFHGQERSKRKK